jgi:uncharacterized protein (TIGR00251 family)
MREAMARRDERDDFVTRISVRLTPRANVDAIDGWHGAELRARVRRPPVEGEANDALVRLLASALGVAPSCVAIVSGLQSRRKVVELTGVTDDDVRRMLGG